MTRRMLIDSTHPEEIRVTVVNGNRLEEFDYETATKAQLKGNIYLAKVTRVEPSLQAAFVEYGGNRHGFLAFSEIHPDYYQIPVADREEDEVEDTSEEEDDTEAVEDGKPVEELGGDEGGEDAVEEVAKMRRTRPRKQYKIQEVIKRRQVILIQVVKEERGNKGAALTSYLSLAGRYCVLMPNTSRGGGVSRKISNGNDRKRLKSVLAELDTPAGMSVIVRTAGSERSKVEIRRDFDYIFKLWDDIRTKTLAATAPALIHEEASLIKRSIRDLYTKDMEDVQVAGEQGYRIAKDFMKALIPSHARKVQRYKDENGIPLFQRYQVETQLIAIHDSVVRLRSGGSIVINQTEALVAIDVNSGKATRERHIDDTAYKTNLEAAEEVARQLRLRDLAGLIVIDFIDMDDNKNDLSVERKLKEALRRDRARIQVGRISPFGLLEMSRQRLRPSLMEAISQQCPTCGGVGFIQSTDSAALAVLRSIEEEGLRRRSSSVTVVVPTDVALYILNHKRAMLADIEKNYKFSVLLQASNEMLPPNFELTRIGGQGEVIAADAPAAYAAAPVQADANSSKDENSAGDANSSSDTSNKRNRRRRRGRKRSDEVQNQDAPANDDETGNKIANSTENSDGEKSVSTGNVGGSNDSSEGDSDDEQRKRRKRGRRGGRRRRGNRPDNRLENKQDGEEGIAVEASETPEVAVEKTSDTPLEKEESKPRRTRRHRGARKDEELSSSAPETEVNTQSVVAEALAVKTEVSATEEAPKVKRGRGRPRRVKEAPSAVTAVEVTADLAEVPQPETSVVEKAKPAKKARAKKTAAKRATKKPAAKIATAKQPVPTPVVAAPVAESTPTPVATPAVENKPTPVTEPEKPKRKGWWNRVMN